MQASASVRKRAFVAAMNLQESRFGRALIPRGLARAVRRRVRSGRSTFKTDLPHALDEDRTLAFFAGIPTQGIFITAKGAERERIRRELKERLLDLKLPDGTPAADGVWFPEEIYSGPEAAYSPDLVFVLKDFAVLARPLLGDWRVFRPSAATPNGFHRTDGIFLAFGKSIKAGKVEPLEMVDVMPTVLYAMGERVPEGLDGKVRTDIFGEPEPIEYRDPIPPPYMREDAFTDDEQQAIKKRLSGLGYF